MSPNSQQNQQDDSNATINNLSLDNPIELVENDVSIDIITGDSIDEIPKEELWDEIGFHRPLAGFWYKLVYEIGILLIPAVFAIYMLTILYPFPTSIGYRTTFTGLFVLVFQAFDMGTSNTISRFVADENIKNPARMVQYIQYFIWYQAVTGLLQVTFISIWCLYFVPETEYAYGIWIMLIVVTKQYPGFPGVFTGTLNSLQLFNKKATLDFLQSEAIQRLTEIIFVLWGKWYGENNPHIGPMLGIAIGATFGLYLDDIIVDIIGAFFLAKALSEYGITFKRMFMVEFDSEIVKECLLFGIKTGLPGILFASTQLISLTLCLQYIPQFTTFVVLKDMSVMLVATSDRMVRQDFTPVFTEAFQNGKVKLCQYYHAHAMRFYFINSGFAIVIMLTIMSMFENVFIGFGLNRYLLTIPFLVPALIYRASWPYERYPNSVLIAAHRPNALFLLKAVQELLKILCWYLTIVVFRIQDLGLGGIVYALTLSDFPAIVFMIFAGFRYIDRKIFPLKHLKWQTFVVPVIATTILYVIFYIGKHFILLPMWENYFVLTLVLGITFIILLVLFFYFPLTVYLGGWDSDSIRDFKKVEKMAGPSKFLVKPISKMIFWVADKKPKLHNQFRNDELSNAAITEIKELLLIRDSNREKILKSSK